MAGRPDEVDLGESLTSHVVTTAALLDAMMAHGVPASSTPAPTTRSAGHAPDAPVSDDASPARLLLRRRKVAAEAVLQLYVDRY